MHKLNDGVHNCKTCNLFPCTSQPEVNENEICKSCPIPSRCCNSPLLPIMPCEEQLNIKFLSNGW